MDGESDRSRCGWVGPQPEYVSYHDTEWGVPSRDDRHLFELLTLEGAQAGLSWLTILRRRDGYRRAFRGFDLEEVAEFEPADVERLVRDPGIVRHRGKIESTVTNARAALEVIAEVGSLSAYLWAFVGDEPIRNRWRALSELPAQTAESNAMSRGLRARGFRFVGPTTCYAFMQAVGMVNDHEIGCFRHGEVERAASKPGARSS